jgi:pyrroloquinoline quinone biosynthesis protein E
VTKESLKEWIDAGVHGIFISLNGSTEEINAKTRDGFKLAVNAIKLLKETDFDYTCINWVMHGCNADDFPNMIKMAEEYGIKHIAVMVFKPDASHQLPNLPTKEQMQTVAKIIKNYKGRVKIEAEECFSQMRAMTGERFFINLNTGISRGCGAGRDGISINVDGKITPCRHLEFPEKARSIRDYWYNSPILKELRSLEDKKLSETLDYHSIGGLRLEARQKLSDIRPITVGQASRISGVSPADINVLLVYLEKEMRSRN